MKPQKVPAVNQLAGDAELSGEEGQTPRFSQLAHTFQVLSGFFGSEVYDRSGMTVDDDLVILQQHDHTKIVGKTEKAEMTEKGLQLSGVLFDSEHANNVRKLAKQGLKWQASIGVRTLEVEWVDEGQSCQVNGQQLSGPLLVHRKSRVYESSFCPVGADSRTSAQVWAGSATAEFITLKEDPIMAEEKATMPAKVPATVKELREQFPNEPQFVLAQLELGSTVLEAKANYADVLAEKVKELQARPGQAPNVPGRVAGSQERQPTSAVAEWNEKLSSLIPAGATAEQRWSATRKLAISEPKLHAAMLEEHNAARKGR